MRSVSINQLADLANTGDCLLFKGKTLISKIIMWFTEYSHAALLVKSSTSKLYMVEATLPQCELRDPFKKIAEASETYLFKPKYITDQNRICIRDEAFDIVATGVRYDLKSLFRNIISRTSLDSRNYFCSELVWDVWVTCGVAPDWAITAPRPGDIPQRIVGKLYKIVG